MSNLSKKLQKLNNRKIALLGLGLDNRALLKLLDDSKTTASITICDFRNQDQLSPITLKNIKVKYQLGTKFNKDLYKFDILFRSPGWPLSCPGIREAKSKGQSKINSPINLFFQLCPTLNIIGVTGSKGKGTTTTLIYKILSDAGKQAWLGGNIGISPLSFLNQIKINDWVVLELSSFQLEDIQVSPRIAVITNLFQEHLSPADPNNPNFHSSYNKYWQAKLNIAKHPHNKYLIINKRLKNKVKTLKLNSKIIYFTASPLASGLIGEYNKENIGAAIAVAKILKIAPKKYSQTIANFHNLEHRLEFVIRKNKVDYFDNSFSTTPESTILDLKSFKTPLILLAGGADKGANFTPLAKIIKKKVKFLILFAGKGTERIKQELININFPTKKIKEVNSMKVAITSARAKARPGDTILLSTACASFGIFKNYKERGNLFKKYAQLD